MTKQEQEIDIAAVSLIRETGAPDMSRTAVQMLSGERPWHLSLSIPPSSVSGQMEAVLTDGRVLLLPERALDAGASALRLSSGECVRLRDYADSVGPLLEALERQGLISVLACDAIDRQNTTA